MKRVLGMCLVLLLLLTLLPGAGMAEGRERVLVWHLWTGGMEASMTQLAEEFNATNEKYYVECLSVPDFQKITVAISSNDGPDLTDSWNSYVAQFADMGAMEPLDSYIESSQYDLSDYNKAALDACRYNGVLYALPCNMNVFALYYNKDLLAAAGYDEPPKTYEEMLEAARATTSLNEDGSFKTFGFPAWPKNNYKNYMLYALGGNWIDADTHEPTVELAGNLLTLQGYYDYVENYGADNVSIFTSAGKTNDPTDPFLNGKQALRIDGPWTSGYFEDLGLDTNWGVTYLPYPENSPELKGRQPVSCSTFYIPSTAKCKEGAWEFLQFIMSEHGQKTHIISNANLPVRMSLFESEEYKAMQKEAEFFAELASNENLIGAPNYAQITGYTSAISEQLDLCFALEQTPEETISKIRDIAQELF